MKIVLEGVWSKLTFWPFFFVCHAQFALDSLNEINSVTTYSVGLRDTNYYALNFIVHSWIF